MKLNLNKRSKLTVLMLIYVAGIGGCKKFNEVNVPIDRITEASVFNNDLTATGVLNGIYYNISDRGRGLYGGDLITISKWAGLSADELDLWTGAGDDEKAYYLNTLFTRFENGSSTNGGVQVWNVSYTYIFRCNQAIEGISKSTLLAPSVKQQLLGEAKFLRAFLYFYLVNLYGDVPIPGVDPKVNRLLPRRSKNDVYDQIIMDLKEASSLLSQTFLANNLKTVSVERVRPTKWAADALLARVYLFLGEYAKAEDESTKVINQTALFDVASVQLDNVFKKNSKEAIWQLQPVAVGFNTIDAQWFVLSDEPQGFTLPKTVYLSDALYKSFEAGDNRKLKWIGSYDSTFPIDTYRFPYKYKKAAYDPAITGVGGISEYHMVLRLSEQYMIRAEARANQDNSSGAIADLNIIRTRARAVATGSIPNPLPDLSASLSKEQVIAAVMQERRVELFTEWGHRWLDLKRTGLINSVMSIATPLKGGVWQMTDALYPIPVDDIKQNPNLVQNSGY